mmetsp:Transcript_19349/g.43886  ORF Transcript_19349/g.43886 Transcript_19349/m.43886 type:complete len:151 (+) Transcript_19349:55-507(+)|eukprot:CAMPEP_0172625224 /NCGR_PEP_ID=MMETSP1068-20121228/142492_1 /TAXON_ID=35684 /ORGANISM="Pseudopedinella elastica, Strain CCMP716" /LENGTH=150 /DNA_ID=CAMNT_0013434451 /DNA_START=27 /DNA_END=479 /DNA_ORIENTATION=-
MAKGLRAKTRKRNRAIMRATHGKEFQEKIEEKTSAKLRARIAAETGTESSSLLRASQLLGGGVSVPGAAMEDEDDEQVEQGSGDDAIIRTSGVNELPRKHRERGNRSEQKFKVRVVQRDSSGKLISRKAGRLPGRAVRVTGGRPKEMVSF